MNEHMLEARVSVDAIRRSYNFSSYFYGWLVAPLERKPRMLGLSSLGVRPQDRILEVAVGPGATLVEIAKLVKQGKDCIAATALKRAA